jgi:hypothetical protein
MTEQERHDQQEFDEGVARKGKLLLQALAGVGIVAALLMSMVALIQSGDKHESSVSSSQPASQSSAKAAALGTSSAAPGVFDVKIIGGEKPGPDGKKHDFVTKTEYDVKVGQPVKLRIDNTDDVPHSISSPEAGVSIIAQPGVHTYTLLVNKAGKFLWYCMLPCDGDAHGWAMQHPGYMSGYIRAV